MLGQAEGEPDGLAPLLGLQQVGELLVLDHQLVGPLLLLHLGALRVVPPERDPAARLAGRHLHQSVLARALRQRPHPALPGVQGGGGLLPLDSSHLEQALGPPGHEPAPAPPHAPPAPGPPG